MEIAAADAQAAAAYASSPRTARRPTPGSRSAQGRQRRRRRHRRADGDGPRRAAIVGHRRRRLPGALEAKKKNLETYDGRETAPKSVTPNLFIGADGKPMNYIEAVVGGHSVGVPGVIAVMWSRAQGTRRPPWAELFDPAIELAEKGFPVSTRLAHAGSARIRALALIPDSAAYFFVPAASRSKPARSSRTPPTPRRCARSPPRPRRFLQGPGR